MDDSKSNQKASKQDDQSNGNSRMGARLVLALLVLLIAVAGVFLVARNGDTSDYPTSLQGGVVQVDEVGFSPRTINVKVGESVTWTNVGDVVHQIASDPHPHHDALPGLFSPDPVNPGDSYTYTFGQAGTYTYHDHLNPIKMLGTVVVE